MEGVRRFELRVVEPFRLDLTTWVVRRRSHNAIDRFDGTRYRRTVVAGGRVVELAVTQADQRTALVGELRGAFDGAPDMAEAEAEARTMLGRLLGLGIDLGDFYALAERDPRLTSVAARFRGMRPPRFPTVFEAVVNAIACQQLSLSVGIHLLSRLAVRYGPSPSEPGAPAGFPPPDSLADADLDDLRLLGFSRSKARSIVSLARRVANGELDLEALEHADDDDARAVLLGLEGIGRWSAEYTLLRGLGRLHVLPGDDVGARNNLARRYGLDPAAGYPELAALARAWWPYGGLVYFHLLLEGLAEAGQLAPRPPADP